MVNSHDWPTIPIIDLKNRRTFTLFTRRQASLSWAAWRGADSRGRPQSRRHRLSERAVSGAAPFRLTRQGKPCGQAWRVDRHRWRFPGTSKRCRCGFGNAGPRFRGRETIDPDRARRCQCAARDADRVGSDFCASLRQCEGVFTRMAIRKQLSLSSPLCFFLSCWLQAGFWLKTSKRRNP